MLNSKTPLVTTLLTALIIALQALPTLAASSPVEMSLNGAWEIVFDHDNVGREHKWHTDKVFGALDNRREISVPSAWELMEQDYEGVAFYRRTFAVPEDWAGKIARIRFDAVNYIAEVYVNDQVAGRHEGGFTPFELRVDRLLKPGEENVITLRVQGPLIRSEKEVDGIRRLETPQWRGGITGGIWQSVKLIATDAVYLKDVFLKPDWKTGELSVNVQVDQTDVASLSAEILLNVKALGGKGPSVASDRVTVALRPGTTEHGLSIDVPEAIEWALDNPYLYEANVSVLIGGEVSDTWKHRFGFRELTIKDKDFYLNGERIYLKATFFEAVYPNGIAMPDSRDMARKEIQLAKEAGFNMMRPWRRPSAPMWLDLADEMGMLVVGSPALECMRLPLSTPSLLERVEREIRESVLRDRNRTSVVKWELFNELHRPILMQAMRSMVIMTRELDPTRLILDESGGWAYGASMYLPNEYEPNQFNDIHSYVGPFTAEYNYDAYLTIGMTDEEKKVFEKDLRTPGRNVKPGLMSFVSEIGYGSLPNLTKLNMVFEEKGNPLTPAFRYHARIASEQQSVLEESGFAYQFPEMEDFYLMQQEIHGAANKRMIEAVRSNPEIDGYCVHAFQSGDWIFGAGLIDIWRNPKTVPYESTKAANQDRIVSIRPSPRNVYAEEGMRLVLNGINDLESVDSVIQLKISSSSGKRVFDRTFKHEWKEGVSSLFDQLIPTKALQGTYTVEVEVRDRSEALISSNAYDFDVFQKDQLAAPKAKIAVLDTDEKLIPFLKKNKISYQEFSATTPLGVPVFVTDMSIKDNAHRELVQQLKDFISKGGTAVYIGAEAIYTSKKYFEGQPRGVLPFQAKFDGSKGLWTCIPHLVKDHPIFAGLPVDGAMQDLYENVYAKKTMASPRGETICASIGYLWFNKDLLQQYYGPGDSWWGSDVAIVPHGEGKCIVSMLRILQNLGEDPVADKLLFNLIDFVSQ